MLLTKLHIPSPTRNLVHRSKLFDKLNEGLNSKLILISAPAGFGKTMLISDWIDQNKIPAAWYSLDNGDNATEDFLSYIILGIQKINTNFGAGALKLIQSSNSPNSESIASMLLNDILNINQDFLLVLDDFHVIVRSEILKIVDYLLEHLPQNVHIVISTRSDPSFALARLRSQNQLLELRSSELSFSVNDISILFNKKLKLGLSIKDIESIESKTEGWIAGLQLAALSIKGYKDASVFIKYFTGNNRYIMDYLIEEVLKTQSDDVKDFLLKTSILEQFSAPLCDAVLDKDNSQSIIEELEKNNIFIFPLDEIRQWYRYHHLFADLLKQRLLMVDNSPKTEIHNKACTWFEQNEMFEYAIEHALKINNYQKSIHILTKIVESMWENGRHSAILKYGDLLPDTLISDNPIYCLYYCWILISNGEVHKAAPLLEVVQKKISKLILEENSSKETVHLNQKLSGKISLAYIYMKTPQNNPERTIDSCTNAMKYLSADDFLWFGWAWFFIGNAEVARGNYDKSKDAFKNGLEYSKKSGHLFLISSIAATIARHEMLLGHYKSSFKQLSDLLDFINDCGYSGIEKREGSYSGIFTRMSVAQCVWTDFDDALENVKIAYDLCRNGNNISNIIMALLAYSYILYALENKTAAVSKLTELENVLKENKISPYLASTYIGWKIYLLVDSGRFDEADYFARENGLSPDGKISYENQSSYIFYIRLFIAQDLLYEATQKLSEFYKIARAEKRDIILVQLNILSAIICKKNNDHDEAVVYLMEAMELAADEDLLNFFLFDYELFHDCFNDIYKIWSITKTNIPGQFIKKLQSTLKNKEKRKKKLAESELSIREIETLGLIAKDLSNQEIADLLFISLNTVKTHVKHILWKLDAEKRSQAVTKAKKLGIL